MSVFQHFDTVFCQLQLNMHDPDFAFKWIIILGNRETQRKT